MMETEDLKKIHFDNYKNAIIENIKRNTNTLVEDIKSLAEKPPLEAMDVIRGKFLEVAKKEGEVVNIEKLDKIVSLYRSKVVSSLDDVGIERNKVLLELVDNFKYEDNIFKLSKKNLATVNKKNKTYIKDILKREIEELIKNIDGVFRESDKKERLESDVCKYLRGIYIRQCIENMEVKVIVKDTTLINGIKELAERYLFTINNSRLLKEDLEN